MTLNDHVRAYRTVIETSFANGVKTVESAHGTFIDMSLAVLRELGLPEGLEAGFRTRHDRAMHAVYDGVVTVNHEIGELVVAQFDLLTDFARRINAEALGDEPVAPGPPARGSTRPTARGTQRRVRALHDDSPTASG
jgi:hypothetical protein